MAQSGRASGFVEEPSVFQTTVELASCTKSDSTLALFAEVIG